MSVANCRPDSHAGQSPLGGASGKGDIIALDNDPLPCEEKLLEEKVNNLKLSFGHFSQTFLSTIGKLKSKTPEWSLKFRTLKSFLLSKRGYLPHLGILVFAILAGSSNLASAQKADEYARLSTTDPASTSVVIQSLDPFTPQVAGAQIYNANTDTTLAVNDGFIDKPQLVETKITDRSDGKVVTANAQSTLDNTSKAITYIVADGDTLSGLGWRFGLKLQTLKYDNNISDADTIKPGQKLKIAKAGTEISTKQIAAKQKKLALASRTTTTRNSSSSRSSSSVKTRRTGAGFLNSKYAPGYCTSYAYDVTGIDPGGNGGQWLRNAQRIGLPTGKTPRAGSVFVTSESWAGHVGVVTAVNSDGSFETSEMNFDGWGVVSSRTLSASSVKGFIY